MPYPTPAEARATAAGPLAAKVLDYSLAFKQVVDGAAGRALTADDWAPIAALIATDRFERVGVAKERMDWPTYAGFLSQFAGGMDWHGYVRRVTEAGNIVFLELEEHCTMRGQAGAVPIANTMTVYEFDAAGLITHLDVYLQSESVSGG